ncbi:MAG: glycerol-3-phosphate acyltransferase [Chloroflexota bacterium]
MPEIFAILGICLLGYLSGSLTFSIWVTKLVKGVDVRDAGSGHATTTNTIRQAGWLPGVIVLILDIGKGFVPTWLAVKYAPAEWVVVLTAALAVVGHCWPVFAGFRGGMGLAVAGGGFLAIDIQFFFVALGLLIALTLLIRHSARAAIVTGVILAPVFYLFGGRGLIIYAAAASGLVLAVRFLSDYNREYRELWLDREKPEG